MTILNEEKEIHPFLLTSMQLLWHLDTFRRNFRSSDHVCNYTGDKENRSCCLFCCLKYVFTKFQNCETLNSLLSTLGFELEPLHLQFPKALSQDPGYHYASNNSYILNIALFNALTCLDYLISKLSSQSEFLQAHVLANIRFSHIKSSYVHQNVGNQKTAKSFDHSNFTLFIISVPNYLQNVSQLAKNLNHKLTYLGSRKISSDDYLEYIQKHMSTTLSECYHMTRVEKHNVFQQRDDSNYYQPSWISKTKLKDMDLLNSPDVLMFGLLWDKINNISQLHQTLYTIGLTLKYNQVFNRARDIGLRKSSVVILRGMVTYKHEGNRYLTYFYHTNLKIWISFDDYSIQEIGEEWCDVIKDCLDHNNYPLILVYSNPNPHNSPKMISHHFMNKQQIARPNNLSLSKSIFKSMQSVQANSKVVDNNTQDTNDVEEKNSPDLNHSLNKSMSNLFFKNYSKINEVFKNFPSKFNSNAANKPIKSISGRPDDLKIQCPPILRDTNRHDYIEKSNSPKDFLIRDADNYMQISSDVCETNKSLTDFRSILKYDGCSNGDIGDLNLANEPQGNFYGSMNDLYKNYSMNLSAFNTYKYNTINSQISNVYAEGECDYGNNTLKKSVTFADINSLSSTSPNDSNYLYGTTSKPSNLLKSRSHNTIHLKTSQETEQDFLVSCATKPADILNRDIRHPKRNSIKDGVPRTLSAFSLYSPRLPKFICQKSISHDDVSKSTLNSKKVSRTKSIGTSNGVNWFSMHGLTGSIKLNRRGSFIPSNEEIKDSINSNHNSTTYYTLPLNPKKLSLRHHYPDITRGAECFMSDESSSSNGFHDVQLSTPTILRDISENFGNEDASKIRIEANAEEEGSKFIHYSNCPSTTLTSLPAKNEVTTKNKKPLPQLLNEDEGMINAVFNEKRDSGYLTNNDQSSTISTNSNNSSSSGSQQNVKNRQADQNTTRNQGSTRLSSKLISQQLSSRDVDDDFLNNAKKIEGKEGFVPQLSYLYLKNYVSHPRLLNTKDAASSSISPSISPSIISNSSSISMGHKEESFQDHKGVVETLTSSDHESKYLIKGPPSKINCYVEKDDDYNDIKSIKQTLLAQKNGRGGNLNQNKSKSPSNIPSSPGVIFTNKENIPSNSQSINGDTLRCKGLCEEAQDLLNQSEKAICSNDVPSAIRFCANSASRARQAMNIHQADPSLITLARTLYNKCVTNTREFQQSLSSSKTDFKPNQSARLSFQETMNDIPCNPWTSPSSGTRYFQNISSQGIKITDQNCSTSAFYDTTNKNIINQRISNEEINGVNGAATLYGTLPRNNLSRKNVTSNSTNTTSASPPTNTTIFVNRFNNKVDTFKDRYSENFNNKSPDTLEKRKDNFHTDSSFDTRVSQNLSQLSPFKSFHLNKDKPTTHCNKFNDTVKMFQDPPNSSSKFQTNVLKTNPDFLSKSQLLRPPVSNDYQNSKIPKIFENIKRESTWNTEQLDFTSRYPRHSLLEYIDVSPESTRKSDLNKLHTNVLTTNHGLSIKSPIQTSFISSSKSTISKINQSSSGDFLNKKYHFLEELTKLELSSSVIDKDYYSKATNYDNSMSHSVISPVMTHLDNISNIKLIRNSNSKTISSVISPTSLTLHMPPSSTITAPIIPTSTKCLTQTKTNYISYSPEHFIDGSTVKGSPKYHSKRPIEKFNQDFYPNKHYDPNNKFSSYSCYSSTPRISNTYTNVDSIKHLSPKNNCFSNLKTPSNDHTIDTLQRKKIDSTSSLINSKHKVITGKEGKSILTPTTLPSFKYIFSTPLPSHISKSIPSIYQASSTSVTPKQIYQPMPKFETFRNKNICSGTSKTSENNTTADVWIPKKPENDQENRIHNYFSFTSVNHVTDKSVNLGENLNMSRTNSSNIKTCNLCRQLFNSKSNMSHSCTQLKFSTTNKTYCRDCTIHLNKQNRK